MNWDDGTFILRDGRLRTLAGLGSIWLPSSGVDYWPLSSTFLWLEWHLFSYHPLGYHLCSWALHVTSGLLVWRLLARLGLRWGWVGGLLFIVHPLAVESVGWISETKNTFSLPFFLLSLIAYLDFDRSGKTVDYWKSWGFYVAAMLAKASVVMLPVVILLFVWWKTGRVTRLDFKRMAPYFAVALVLGLVTVVLQNSQGLSDAYKPRSPLVVFLCAGEAIFFYLGHFVAPYGLIVIYPRWTFESPTFLQLLPWPLLGVLLVLLWLHRTGWGRHALLGLGFFLITLFPVIGFLNMTFMKISWVADHLVYLPMIGLVGLVAAAGEYAYGKVHGVARLAGVLVGFAWLAVLGFGTFHHAGDFRNEGKLWAATLRFNPTCSQAYNNLGLCFADSNRMQPAIVLYRKALALDPQFADAHNNLGIAYQVTGQPAAALQEYQDAVALKPDYPGMQGNLGQLLILQGRLPEAWSHLELSAELDPNQAQVQSNLGFVLLHLGRSAEAVSHLQLAVQMRPDFVTDHLNMGCALMNLHRFDEAIDEFDTVLRLSPNNPNALALLKKVRAAQGPAPNRTDPSSAR